MDSKRWLACFLATVLLLGAAVVGFNYWVDPFGVFSHKSLEWPSYEMTINPRTAKISYLKDHHPEFFLKRVYHLIQVEQRHMQTHFSVLYFTEIQYLIDQLQHLFGILFHQIHVLHSFLR